MIIVGAGGFAKELMSELLSFHVKEDLYFFDNVSKKLPKDIHGVKIYQDFLEIENKDSEQFCLGLGNPNARKKLYNLFIENGIKPADKFISNSATITSEYVEVGNATVIMAGTIVTIDVKISEGVLINIDCTIGHDTTIGAFSEICPGVHISGNCNIGTLVFIGTGAVILPNIKIGNNSIVAAGSIVTKDIPDNVMVAGIPAVIKKQL